MANIAQTVNVLQAMVLTEENGTRMLVTPTYHVYDMYKDHQGGSALPVIFEAGEIAFPNAGKQERLAGLSGSASLKGKTLTLSVVNSSASEALEAEIVLRGGAAAAVRRRCWRTRISTRTIRLTCRKRFARSGSIPGERAAAAFRLSRGVGQQADGED